MNLGLVAHRFPPEIGGSERYTEVLAHKLHERGHQVTVYTTRHPDRGTDAFPFEVHELINCVPESFGYFAWPGILWPRELRSLRSHDAIHAVAADMFSAVVGATVKRLWGTPSVLTTFYHPPELQVHHRMKRTYDRFVLQYVLKQYDHLLVSSKFEWEQLAENFDLEDVNVRQMKIPSTAESTPGGDFRQEQELTDDFLLLYVGRLDSHKGMSTLLPAVERLSDEIPTLRCIVVGETERWHEWPEQVAQAVSRNRERFVFTGVRTGSELTSVYEAADLFVLPSEYETYGLVTVEALSRATPVVSTPVGIAPELLDDGSNGYLYPVGDTEALVSRIRAVWESNGEVLRSNARESVSGLSWDRTVEKVERLYRGQTTES